MDYTINGTSSGVLDPKPAYFFPILKTDNIQKCMAELGMDLTTEELHDPAHHKEKLRKIFTYLLEICTGKTENDFIATPEMLQKAASLPYPELHQEFGELQFYSALQHMFHIAGYNSFSWRDVHSPTRERLRYQLSAIINFAKFREEQLMIYAELNVPRAKLCDTFEQVNIENSKLLEQYELVVHQSKAQSKEMHEIIQECEELEVEIARNNTLQAKAREEAAALKKSFNDLKDQVVAAVWDLQEAEAEEEKLRLQIVSSPDRRKTELLVRKERLQKVKDECSTLDTSIQECKTKIVNGRQALKELETTNSVLVELKDEASKHTELLRKIEDTKKLIATRNKQLTALQDQSDESNRALAQIEDAVVRQRKQYELQIAAAKEGLDAAQQRLLAVERERRHAMARIDAGAADVRALQATIDAQRDQSQAEIAALIAHYETVVSTFLAMDEARVQAFETHV